MAKSSASFASVALNCTFKQCVIRKVPQKQGTRHQKKGYILVQPLIFELHHIEGTFKSKNSHSSFDFFYAFLAKEGRGKELEARWQVQRDTETQREKLPMRTAQITGAPSETLAHKLVDKREPSAKHIPDLAMEKVSHYWRTRQIGRGRKKFKMFNRIRILRARQLVCPKCWSGKPK